MATKRTFGLASGAGIFFDEETGLKVLPKQRVQIDKDDCGTRTRIAIQNNHLVEVSDKPAETTNDKK